MLHAPVGTLVVEPDGRLRCHLCGEGFRSLGAHVRRHGYTASAYRTDMGLCTREPLVTPDLSEAISQRQATAYRANGTVREALSPPDDPTRSLRALGRARTALDAPDPPQRVARRRASLRAGRATQAGRRADALHEHLAKLGHTSLHSYLRAAYGAGASLEKLARDTGLGRARLRTEMDAARIEVRGTGRNTPAGRRSRARSNEAAAAQRVGTTDLEAWLTARRAGGWSLNRLAKAVGHSTPWVRARLTPAIGGEEGCVLRARAEAPDALGSSTQLVRPGPPGAS